MNNVAMVWMLIENDGALLLVQRKPDMPPFAGEWVLPGATPQRDESASQMLRRVAQEDFDLTLQGEEFVDALKVQSGDVEHDVSVYRVGFEGQPKFRESGPYAEVGWTEPGELDELDIELPVALRAFLQGLDGG